MAELSPEQISFLRGQNIPLSSVFDASGMRRADYQLAMKEEDKHFAYGVSRCGRGGHTLRTRAGHCFQCDHAKIAFQRRHDSPGLVYIAASATGRLIKIGSTINIGDRHDKLNRDLYGGQNGWQILATGSSQAAGRAESEALGRLAIYAVPGST